MRKLILLAVLFCGEVVAQNVPIIVGFIRNKAQGEITFTSETCRADPTMSFAFIRDQGGKLSLGGCWKLVEYNVIVKWSDGDIYSYPVENVVFTDEYNEWYRKNKSRNQNNSNVL